MKFQLAENWVELREELSQNITQDVLQSFFNEPKWVVLGLFLAGEMQAPKSEKGCWAIGERIGTSRYSSQAKKEACHRFVGGPWPCKCETLSLSASQENEIEPLNVRLYRYLHHRKMRLRSRWKKCSILESSGPTKTPFLFLWFW